MILTGVFKNLVGRRYGRLVVKKFLRIEKHKALWLCQCDCGGTKIASTSNLNNGNVWSCGCARARDLTNMRFGNLVALHICGTYLYKEIATVKIWLCKCDCGNYTKVKSNDLVSGNTKSCGCLKSALLLQRRVASGINMHHRSTSRLYHVWRSMKQRCNDPKCKEYRLYGGRGISVCDEWANDFLSFEKWAFSKGYDENAPRGKCTLDRIDVNGNYEPSNCRIVTQQEQANNTRKNKQYFYKGQFLTIAQISKLCGVGYSTLYNRLHRGVPVDVATQIHYQKSNGKGT